MKMRITRCTIASVLLLISASVNAEGWTAPGRIIELWVQASDSIAVMLDVPVVHGEGCVFTEYYRIRAENSSGYKTVVAALLSAHAQGKSVKLHISGCAGPTDYPKITNVRIIG